MKGQRFPGLFAEAGNDVEHAVRQPRLLAEPAQEQRAKRRLLGRLQHDRIARDQRRAELPRGDDERIVPRHDRADDAERLLHHHRHIVRADRRDFVGELVGKLGIILDAVGAERDVDGERIGDRLADVERLQERQLLAMLADELGEAQQDFLFPGRVGVAPDPALERAPRGTNRAVDIGRAAIGDIGEDLAVDRRDLGEGRAIRRRDISAVDEGAALDFERRGAGEPAIAGGGAVEHGV